MAGVRRNLADFALANPLYGGATVTVYQVDPTTLQKGTQVAPLYADLTSETLLPNPQALDAEGKWQQPVYVDQPVVMSVSNAQVPDHTTGITTAEGTFRGDWATGIVYIAGDTVRDGAAGNNTSNVYYCAAPHTSGIFSQDLANGYWALYVNAQAGSGTIIATAVAQSLAAVAAAGYLTQNQTITVSGDGSGSGSTSIPLTLANTSVVPGTYTQVTVDAKGRVTSGGTSTAALDGRNAALNGGFSIWQRGTSISNPANNAYTADQWKMAYDGTGSTLVVSQQAVADQGPLDEGWRYYMRYNQSVAGSGGTFRQIVQPIESVATFSGRTVTVEFWAKSNINQSQVFGVTFSQQFGTGGSPSSPVGIGFQFVYLPYNTPTKFALTFNLPSISGKTIGSNNDDHLDLVLVMPLNQVQDISITGFKVRGSSSVGLPGPDRSAQAELAQCQRYYEIGSHFMSGVASAGGSVSTTCDFKVTKRVSPTVAVTATTSTNVTSQSASGAAVSGFEHVDVVTAAGAWTGHCTFTATAEL